jgi:hypothetical protein
MDTDNATPPAETAAEDTPPAEQSDGTDWKARAREWERRAKANADAAKRLQEIEDQSKTEAERMAERLQAAETAAQQSQAEALRYRVGLAHGIPLEFIPRLQGATEDELTADAQALAKSLAPAGKSDTITTKPLATLSLGATPQDEQAPEDPNEAIRRLLSRK